MNASTFHSVRFSTNRPGVYPLTWGQRWIWQGLTGHAPHYGYLGWPVSIDVPAGCGLDVVLSALETVLGRHETLRTRYFLDEHGVPRQVVPADGELRVEAREAGEAGVPETVRLLEQELSGPPFTIPEISVRAAVVTSARAPKCVVLGVFHMATDASGLRLVTSDLQAILRARAEATALPELPPVTHPADRARYEEGREGIKRSARAVAAWQQEVGRFPQRTTPPVRRTPESPRLREHIMRSKALSAAAIAVSRVCRASVDSVIIACTAELLGKAAGQNSCGFLMLAHNRFDEDTEYYSGTLVQSFPVCVELGADSLDGLIRQTHFSVLKAALSCLGNPDDISAKLRNVFESDGAEADLSCAVNMFFPDLGSMARGTDDLEAITKEQAEELMSQTRFSEGEGLEKDDWEFYLNAYQDEDEFVLSLRMDTAVVPSEDIIRFLADLESRLVEALPEGITGIGQNAPVKLAPGL
ncbi:condensation domain-containing protein [Streptomyces sp. R28]|uniref:Condensation domain-containing protein n=1 Tax=Streptomyces sp. R28 TaxID=3238628 RepID=A0AB39QAF0_9ACTN